MGNRQVTCEKCGVEMNHHAEKIVYDDAETDGTLVEWYTCPKCGNATARIHADEPDRRRDKQDV